MRECAVCGKPVPQEEVLKVRCGRCSQLISGGHHIHDACWEEYQNNPEVEDDSPPAGIFTNCNVCGCVLRGEWENQMGMCGRCAAE